MNRGIKGENRIAMTVLKNKAEGLTLPDTKIHLKIEYLRQYGTGTSTDRPVE